MNPLVSPEVAAFREPTVTLLTFVGSFPRVPSHVNLQSATPHEIFPTFLACVGSFTRVPPLMISKMPLRGEAHAAVSELAPERLLSVVYPHMCE
jgi:hypothetical protein